MLSKNDSSKIDFVRSSGYNYICIFASYIEVFEKDKEVTMEYLSIKQMPDKWGFSERRIQRLCTEGKIPGATKIGSYWAVPVDAENP